MSLLFLISLQNLFYPAIPLKDMTKILIIKVILLSRVVLPKKENNTRKSAILNNELNTIKDINGVLTNKENKNISYITKNVILDIESKNFFTSKTVDSKSNHSNMIQAV